MTEPSIAAEDMDAILDDALDELDDSDSDGEIDTGSSKKPQQTDCASSNSDAGASKQAPVAERKDPRRVPFGPPRPPPASNNNKNTTKKQGEIEPDAMEESILKMFRDLAVEADAPPNSNKAKTPESKPPSKAKDASTIPGDEKMLQDLFQGLMAAGGDNTVDGDMPDMDEIPDLDNLFAGLSGAGDGPKEGGFNSDDFVDGMMEQLLSKELMYEPMKQVTEKFPAWLASKKQELAPDEWDQRNRQYQCFQRLVQAYENESTDQKGQTAKLLEIMQEVQEYGQPPHEIINEIAPGLELDQDGLPKMNGGMMPPFLGGNPEDCRIM